MTSMRYILFWATTVAVSMQSAAATWLSPEATEKTPYNFLDKAGMKVTLPSSTDYRGWSIFNAATLTQEAEQEYDVSAEGDTVSEADKTLVGPGMLRFGNQVDEGSFLSLGISENAEDQDQLPIEMVPSAGKVRIDNVYARVRFVECSDHPDPQTLLEMYPTVKSREANEKGELSYTAAKLGVYVGPDNRFYVSRVRSGTPENPGSGDPKDYTFEFCDTLYSYEDVGGGEVIVRIEFNTYLTDDGYFRRAFRIFVKDATDADAAEYCLTEKRGYEWLASSAGDYQFDFSSLEKGEWFYAFDDSLYAGLEETEDTLKTMDLNPLDRLNRIAFSANDGGFYAAWMDVEKLVDDVETLKSYSATLFTPYISQLGANFDLYAAWAAKYNVSLTEYLPRAEGISLYGASTAADEQRAFDAFLLYMDPKTNEPLRLTVTGLVTNATEVEFTVVGPEGCNLREAVNRAARLRIRRAATLAEFANAQAEEYAITFNADGTEAYCTIPKVENGVEMPFMQATLVSVADLAVDGE